ncbi:M15 family metallopeptidase [Legionella cardiaca]|uniref:M15 family metallopeptidase n=1 Tax=Legionella cardiaca TaxID=1071983 RepID=A0ABY8AT43_9GAMM|nr:M15 family metallopeptidase [Legionella cardiaca]WED43649.1 M15 family metallopeptidase [Legionella cardiaca]
MKNVSFVVIMLMLALIIFPMQSVAKHSVSAFKSRITVIPLPIQKRIKKYSWHKGCPLSLKDLRYVTLSYWGFDQKVHLGVLIVNKSLAREVVQIFKSIYDHRFPIERMTPVDVFKGNDVAAMRANNTSSFNCRAVTGQPGIFSQHSYGRAIDINPVINPYVSGQQIEPSNGVKFVDRKNPHPGKITRNSFIYKLFIQYGWDWGGNWYDVQDYQHFEKRAKGEKRNPYGYVKSRAFSK